MRYAVSRLFRVIGNAYWKLFGGVALCVIMFALGAVAALTIVGAPLSASFFRAGKFVWKPFGKQVAVVPSSPIVGVVWAASGGVFLGVLTLVAAMFSFVTIAAIPLVYQWLKVAVVLVFPFSVTIA